MLLDILSERGFLANVDIKTIEKPVRVDAAMRIITESYASSRAHSLGSVDRRADIPPCCCMMGRLGGGSKHAWYFQIAFPRQHLRGDFIS